MHEEIFQILGNTFYDVVPVELRTYCALNSKICQGALQHLKIDATVSPCEVWYADAEQNFVLGLVQKALPDQWPGHAICMTDGWLIDTALHTFKREFNVNVPRVVVARTFGVTSNVIARLSLGAAERLWWVHPHRDVVMEIPDEPADVVMKYSLELAQRIEAALAFKNSHSIQSSNMYEPAPGKL